MSTATPTRPAAKRATARKQTPAASNPPVPSLAQRRREELARELATVGVTLASHVIDQWAEADREAVANWLEQLSDESANLMLPRVLRGKLPAGWRRKDAAAKRAASVNAFGEIAAAFRDELLRKLFGQHLLVWSDEERHQGVDDDKVRERIVAAMTTDSGDPAGNTHQIRDEVLPAACWQVVAGNPQIWFGQTHPGGTDPHLEGAALVAQVREVLQLPRPGEASPSNGKPRRRVTGPLHDLADAPSAEGRAWDPDGPAIQHGVEIPLSLIDDSTTNTRRDYGDAKGDTSFRELVDSLKRHGQLQEMTVVPKGDGRFETKGGSRRKRALLEAGKRVAICCVRRMEAAEAAEVELDENEVRKGLNPIERANAYRQVMLARGLTQEQLARERGVSQEMVSILVGLLDFPEEWQQRVASGQLTPTHMRALRPLLGRAKILKEIDKRVRSQDDGFTVRDFDHLVYDVVRPQSRSLEPAKYKSEFCNDCMFAITDELRRELDVVRLRDWNGHATERAFNTKLWEREQKRAIDEWRRDEAKRRNSRADRAAGGRGSGKTEAEKAKDRARVLAQRLTEYKFAWLQRAVAASIAEAPLPWVIRLLVYYARNIPWGDSDRAAATHACAERNGAKKSKDRWRDVEDAVLSVPPAQAETLAREALAGWLVIERRKADITGKHLMQLAQERSIDIVKQWRLEETGEYLELHTKDQLQELVREWKIGAYCLRAKTRGELVKEILTVSKASSKPLPCPKALAKLSLT